MHSLIRSVLREIWSNLEGSYRALQIDRMPSLSQDFKDRTWSAVDEQHGMDFKHHTVLLRQHLHWVRNIIQYPYAAGRGGTLVYADVLHAWLGFRGVFSHTTCRHKKRRECNVHFTSRQFKFRHRVWGRWNPLDHLAIGDYHVHDDVNTNWSP